MATFLMVLTGCNRVPDIKDDVLSEDMKSDVTEESQTSSNQPKGDALSKLASQEFFIQGEKLGEDDDEIIIEFGKSFVNLYNGAVGKRKMVSFENYITNQNLKEFTDKTVELTQKQGSQGGLAVVYGLDNKFNRIELKHIGENLSYLELQHEFSGSGMMSRMLITSEDKSLKLIDLYFGNKDGADTYATGHHVSREINDPNLWEDEEWVEDVFHKLLEFEEALDS